MKSNRHCRILILLEKGLLTDSARLKELDRDLVIALKSARSLGLERCPGFASKWVRSMQLRERSGNC